MLSSHFRYPVKDAPAFPRPWAIAIIAVSIGAMVATGTRLAEADSENVDSNVFSAGERVYFNHCANCHGDEGQGVDEEYDEPLWGSKSITSLTRYIHKSMPEDDEKAVVDEDAAAVATYIYDAFYSPAAQARNRESRVDLLRLTNEQYRPGGYVEEQPDKSTFFVWQKQ